MKLYDTKIHTLFIFLVLFSCESASIEEGNGNITTREQSLQSFNEITVKGNFEITLKPSSSPLITVTTDENLHNYIRITREDSVVDITTNKTLKSKEPIKMVIEYQRLTAVSSNGTSVMKNSDTLRTDYLRIDMAGAGTIDLKLDVKALKVSISGAGAVALKGKATEQNIQMSGAGSLEAYELISQICRINISGVGGASINVRKTLVATVSGVGGISYRGSPEKVISDVSGLGTITKVKGSDDQQEEI